MKLQDIAGRFVRPPRRKQRNLVGRRFGRLKVIRFAGYITVAKGNVRRLWKCACSSGSGRNVIASTNSLNIGNTQSCGCRRKDSTTVRNKARAVHNHTAGSSLRGKPRKPVSPTYMSWQSMRQRCLNPNTRSFVAYGGTGVRICRRWDSFLNFLSDVGKRPHGRTLGRLADSDHYTPSNCRWMTRPQQEREARKKLWRKS